MKNPIVSAILAGASLLPGVGPAIGAAKEALEDERITINEVENFVDKSLTAIENYTPPLVDAVLEQFKVVLRECIVLEERIVLAAS